MATKAVLVDKNNNTVVVVSDAATLSLKMQELRTDEADRSAVKQASALGLSRAGIADAVSAYRHPETKEIIHNPQVFSNNPANKGIVLEPCKIFTLR